MDDGKIDLVRYGVLYQKVENYEDKFDASWLTNTQ
jgi:hypothetical protein